MRISRLLLTAAILVSTKMSAQNTSSQHLVGKTCFVYGDSYVQFHSTNWFAAIQNITGCSVVPYNSNGGGSVGISGGTTQDIFSQYPASSGTSNGTSVNIFEPARVVHTSYISTTDGSIQQDSPGYTQYEATGFMNVSPGQLIVTGQAIVHISGVGVAFYDRNKSFISGVDGNTSTYTVPTNAYYMRETLVQSNESTLMVGLNPLPSTYTPFTNPPDYGQGETSSGSNASLQGYIQATLRNVDVVIIEFGINDGRTLSSNLGAPGDGITANTEYGYILNALTQIQQAKPSVRIIWVGPPQPNPASFSPQSNALTPTLMVSLESALKYVTASRGVPFVDLNATSGINSDTWSLLMQDGIHVQESEYGTLYGTLIANAMNQLITF